MGGEEEVETGCIDTSVGSLLVKREGGREKGREREREKETGSAIGPRAFYPINFPAQTSFK